MWIRIILLILISSCIFVYGKDEGNKSRLLSNGSPKSRMKQLKSPMQIYSIKSTYKYVRILVWYTLLTPEQLKIYFDNFELLKFKAKWLDNHAVDIIKQTDTIYEQFMLFYHSEKQSIITVFLKLNLQNSEKKFLIKSTIEEVEQALKNYGFIIVNKHPTLYTILCWFALSLLFCCIIISTVRCIVPSLIKLCSNCKKKNVKKSLYIHTEDLLNQNVENKFSSQNEPNSVKIDIPNLLNQTIDSKSRLQDIQNWVDHINEYKDSPETEKKSFVGFDDDVSSFSNDS